MGPGTLNLRNRGFWDPKSGKWPFWTPKSGILAPGAKNLAKRVFLPIFGTFCNFFFPVIYPYKKFRKKRQKIGSKFIENFSVNKLPEIESSNFGQKSKGGPLLFFHFPGISGILAILGPFWAIFAHFGSFCPFLGHFWGSGPDFRGPGQIFRILGPFLGVGSDFPDFGASFRGPGRIFRILGPPDLEILVRMWLQRGAGHFFSFFEPEKSISTILEG